MKVQRSSKFLPNENNRRMFPGFVFLCIVAVGVALGFLSFAINMRWLGFVGYGICVIGALGVGFWIIRGWWLIFTRRW